MPITTKEAVNKLTSALKTDSSFFTVWQTNIAVAILSTWEKAVEYTPQQSSEMHLIVCEGAKRFLDLLCEDRPTIPSTGAELITQERWEQINKHGFDVANDDYKEGELIEAALFSIDPKWEFSNRWPEDWIEEHKQKIIAKDRIGQLKVAGAFIAAEIDREQNQAAKKSGRSETETT